MPDDENTQADGPARFIEPHDLIGMRDLVERNYGAKARFIFCHPCREEAVAAALDYVRAEWPSWNPELVVTPRMRADEVWCGPNNPPDGGEAI